MKSNRHYAILYVFLLAYQVQVSTEQSMEVSTPDMLLIWIALQKLAHSKNFLSELQLQSNQLKIQLQQENKAISDATFSLQQIESAYRTQQQLLLEWEGKFKTAEQFRKLLDEGKRLFHFREKTVLNQGNFTFYTKQKLAYEGILGCSADRVNTQTYCNKKNLRNTNFR